jgi:CheY-like chemotaxis protein
LIEVENGQAGTNRIKQQRPDLILLNLMMPELDGFGFMAELRWYEEWWSIPVVVLTAKALTEEDRRLLNGQVHRILQKGSFSRDELLEEIRRKLADRIRMGIASLSNNTWSNLTWPNPTCLSSTTGIEQPIPKIRLVED